MAQAAGAHGDESGVVGRRLPAGDAAAAASADPYDLSRRFCATQAQDFSRALSEINAGAKRSCWSWYVFPTGPFVVGGRERGSSTNRHYALRDIREGEDSQRGENAARAFLRFKAGGVDLRANYVTMMAAVAAQLEAGVEPERLVGCLDDPKLRSSLHLFEQVSRAGHDDEVNKVCRRALAALRESPAA